MNSQAVGGGIGLLAGGVAGWFLGNKLSKGQPGDLPLGEFLGIVGGIAGGVIGAAINTPPATTVAAAGTVPTFVPGENS